MAAVAAPPVVTLGKDAGPPDVRISRWDRTRCGKGAVAAQDAASPADMRRIVLVQARWRGRRARRLYKSVVKRAYIVREVWQTERAYVESLKFTHEAYELGLRDRLTKGSPIASEKYIDAIFYEVSTLLACNKSLLEQLDARVAKWNCDSVVGDIFVERSKSFEVYTSFVNNFDRAMAYVRKLNTSEAFQKFVAQLDSTTRSRLRLNDFLIMPIQRIPRYELLLEQMLNATPAWHADHALLKSAVKEIKRVADYVNEKKREVEAAAKVKELQAKLSSDCPPLVTEQRRLIRDGDVVVAIKNERAMRHIFLFNDAILSSVRVDGSQGGIAKVFSSNVEYNFEWMVPLVNLIHITPLEKPVRARHHEPEMLMKKIKEIERQIHVERTIEKSAARIAQIYKAEHSKASKHQAKTTVGETESKIEQLTKQLKDHQALIRLNEPTVGLTLATDNHMTVTLVLRSPAQRAEWMTEIVKYRQIQLDMLRRMEEDAALTATKSRASKDKGAATGWSIKTFVQGTTSTISSTLSRKAGRTAALPGPGGKDAPAPATGAKAEPAASDRRTSAPATVGGSGAKQGSSKSITPSIRVAAPRASAAAIVTAPPVPPGPPASAPVKPSIFRFGHSRGSSVTQPPPSADKAADAPSEPTPDPRTPATAPPGPVATPSSQTQADSTTTPTPAPATATTESLPSSAAPASATPAPTPAPATPAPASAPAPAEAPAGGLRETRASSASAEEASPPTAGLAGAAAASDAAPAPSSAPAAPEPSQPPAEAAPEPAKLVEAVPAPAKAEEKDEEVAVAEAPALAAQAVAPPDVVVVAHAETATDPSEAPASPGLFSDGEAAEAAHADGTVDAAAASTAPFLSPELPASEGGASASVSLHSLVSPRPAPLTMVIASAALQGGDSPLSGGFSMVPLERAAAHSSHEEIKAIADEVELAEGATALPPIDEEPELEEERAAAAGPADALTSPEPEPSLDRLDAAISDADVDSLATTEVDVNYSELSAIDQHSFEPCKLERKVYCQVCDELMRAGSKDAVKCTRCSFRCHADCVKNASAACTHMPDMLTEDALNLGTLFHIDSPMV